MKKIISFLLVSFMLVCSVIAATQLHREKQYVIYATNGDIIHINYDYNITNAKTKLRINTSQEENNYLSITKKDSNKNIIFFYVTFTGLEILQDDDSYLLMNATGTSGKQQGQVYISVDKYTMVTDVLGDEGIPFFIMGMNTTLKE